MKLPKLGYNPEVICKIGVTFTAIMEYSWPHFGPTKPTMLKSSKSRFFLHRLLESGQFNSQLLNAQFDTAKFVDVRSTCHEIADAKHW